MDKYTVQVEEIYLHTVTVKAENVDEAKRKAQQIIKERAWRWCLAHRRRFKADNYRLGDFQRNIGDGIVEHTFG